jgi:hypothetical protein
MDETDPEYWPTQLREIFAAIGAAMVDTRLTPDTLRSVRLPNDEFTICHVSAEEAGWKRGHYRISMAGGQWTSDQGYWRNFRAKLSKDIPLLGVLRIRTRRCPASDAVSNQVRFGSKGDVSPPIWQVRSAVRSGRANDRPVCARCIRTEGSGGCTLRQMLLVLQFKAVICRITH